MIHAEEDPHASQLVARGHLFDLPIVKRPGKRNRCHSNAAGLWGKNIDKDRLVTGYYLIDGLWRLHSWVIDDNQQYETTVVAEEYFAVELEQEEALHFWFVNYLPEKYPGPMWLMNSVFGKKT